MENWIIVALPILGKVLISIIGIFSIIVLFTRIAGLRTYAKMSSIDFASTIALGSILASVVINTNQSILKGAVALGGIIAFQYVFSYIVRKSKPVKELLTNDPMMLMHNGEILWDNLKKTNVGENDLVAKLREANVIHFNQVLAVIFESTGDISVLHSSEEKELDDRLLTDVKGVPDEYYSKD